MEIGVIQIGRITNDLDFEKLKMLNLDKDTLDAIKKINLDQAKLKKDIIVATDEIKLMEIQKLHEFNNKKLSLLRDRNANQNIKRLSSI